MGQPEHFDKCISVLGVPDDILNEIYFACESSS